MFSFKNWKDHIVQFPNRKKIVDNGDGTSNVTSEPGEIIQTGDPLNATNMNRIEKAILDSHISQQVLLQYFKNFDAFCRQKLEDHDNEFTPEVGEVTLTNAKAFPFNGSGATIALKKARKTMNYDLFPEVVSYEGGEVGEIVVFDKQLNGFKIRFTGSATKVKIKYRVRGGIIV
ncbi:MAG: hypothetical protein EUB_03423 [Eubacterium sp.]|uniref:hypothetical protein n=1 Tax=Eubacterium sp. TaxID=142586 RepID=UPI00306AEB29